MYEKKYSYDDLLLVPQYSDVDTRDNVSLVTNVTPNNRLGRPFVSAPMDSVTGSEMAQAMAYKGGVGIVHRFQDIDKQKSAVESVTGLVGGCVGIDDEELDSAFMLENSGADFICVDVAHGHLEKTIQFVKNLNNIVDVDIMVGNVATFQGAKDLASAGADSIKVGVGPGSHCVTREMTAHGVPQASAVLECSEIKGMFDDVTIIADGGIRKPGDAVKALMLGADAVMMGGIFGRCKESPGGSNVWGCASEEGNTEQYNEGVVSESENKYTVEGVFEEFMDGMRSGLSYSGGHSIQEARRNAEFVEVSSATQERNGGFEI
jgi:IMP dehydrogenase